MLIIHPKIYAMWYCHYIAFWKTITDYNIYITSDVIAIIFLSAMFLYFIRTTYLEWEWNLKSVVQSSGYINHVIFQSILCIDILDIPVTDRTPILCSKGSNWRVAWALVAAINPHINCYCMHCYKWNVQYVSTPRCRVAWLIKGEIGALFFKLRGYN